MTILVDEFFEILGIPKPIGRSINNLKNQFLIKFDELNAKEILSNIIGVRSWDLEWITHFIESLSIL